MMNCWRTKPLLTAFLDQELSPAGVPSFRAGASKRHWRAAASAASLKPVSAASCFRSFASLTLPSAATVTDRSTFPVTFPARLFSG